MEETTSKSELNWTWRARDSWRPGLATMAFNRAETKKNLLFVFGISALLFFAGVWASVNLLRWFWSEVL